jgi:hypothetical protein
MTRPERSLLATLAFCALGVSATRLAQAADAPAGAADGPHYNLELEPHLAFGWDNIYGSSGVGAGLRVGLPVVRDLLPSVPDNLALTFGGDFLHYEGCYFRDRCGANYLMFPATAQWNLFPTPRISIFGEGGVFIYKGFISNDCGPGPGCSQPSGFGIRPTLALGGRIFIAEHVALTARIGYPTITLGASFM